MVSNQKERVAIIGGGPAGMQAALTLADEFGERMKSLTIFDAGKSLDRSMATVYGPAEAHNVSLIAELFFGRIDSTPEISKVARGLEDEFTNHLVEGVHVPKRITLSRLADYAQAIRSDLPRIAEEKGFTFHLLEEQKVTSVRQNHANNPDYTLLAGRSELAAASVVICAQGAKQKPLGEEVVSRLTSDNELKLSDILSGSVTASHKDILLFSGDRIAASIVTRAAYQGALRIRVAHKGDPGTQLLATSESDAAVFHQVYEQTSSTTFPTKVLNYFSGLEKNVFAMLNEKVLGATVFPSSYEAILQSGASVSLSDCHYVNAQGFTPNRITFLPYNCQDRTDVRYLTRTQDRVFGKSAPCIVINGNTSGSELLLPQVYGIGEAYPFKLPADPSAEGFSLFPDETQGLDLYDVFGATGTIHTFDVRAAKDIVADLQGKYS